MDAKGFMPVTYSATAHSEDASLKVIQLTNVSIPSLSTPHRVRRHVQ